MLVLSCVDVEVLLSCFVGDAVLNCAAKHHLIALHEVIHRVLKGWLESFWIDQIKIDFIICGNLYSLVSFDKVDKSSNFNCVVVNPLTSARHRVFLDVKEHDLA